MKVYSISKWVFRAICVLILLLPVGRHWKLLSTGEQATGKVTAFVQHKVESIGNVENMVNSSLIEFEVDGVTYKAYGPKDYEYNPGRSFTIFFKRDDPADNCIFAFSGFYLTYYTVIPIIMLTLWYAFYLSFNNYRKKQRFKKREPRRNTYPSRRIPRL